VITPIQVSATDQLLIDPAKLARELAQALRGQELFVHHDFRGEFRAPAQNLLPSSYQTAVGGDHVGL
jgi:hypothetical protein